MKNKVETGNNLKADNPQAPEKSHDRSVVIGVVWLATLIGAILRAFFVLHSDFPLNDGGLFYTMVQDLQAAHFHLPLFTSYNQANIPFAYPPLPFYLAGVLNSWLHFDLIQELRFLPLVFSVMSIPAFYGAAKQLLKTEVQQLAAVFVFALLPETYVWQIMGGGLTRSIAFFFMLLALMYFLKWIQQQRWPDFGLMILFTALTALCHLDILWTLALSYVLIFLLRRRTWKVLAFLALTAIGAALLTSPWWATVIAQHGLSPFLQAFHSGNFNLLGPLGSLTGLNPEASLIRKLFSVLAILGIFWVLRERDGFLPAWWLVILFFDPRSSLRSATLPIALLAGITLAQGLGWISRNLTGQKSGKTAEFVERQTPDFTNPWIKGTLAVLIIFCFFNDLVGIYLPGSLLSSLNENNREAMQWVKVNTPVSSRFLVIDYPDSWATDRVGEWFPALTGRVSLLTAQGKEWLPGDALVKVSENLTEVSNCRFADVSCLEDWQKKKGTDFEYIYFTDDAQTGEAAEQYTSVQEAQMSTDLGYALVYSNGDVRIFRKK